MKPKVSVRNVALDIPIFTHRQHHSQGWLSTILHAAKSPPKREYRRILDDISFELEDGDRLAIMGRNGAGKTTLLRVLSGAYQPTLGSVDITGQRQVLLNLGLGFVNDATVRENIFLRSLTLGRSLSSIGDTVQPILEFAGLEHRAGERLGTLSSGQRMRLGFSISTALQHDVMLLDEWFGAGDAEFILKARARMTERANGSRIVILASHNFGMLRKVCTRGLVIEAGRVSFDGQIEEAIAAYKKIYQAQPEHKATLELAS
jgi:ABC-type polysaccharide/polyol phosphate transport system ATPase subunit